MYFQIQTVDERQLGALVEDTPVHAGLQVGRKLNELVLKLNKIERDLYEDVPLDPTPAGEVQSVLIEGDARQLSDQLNEWCASEGDGKVVLGVVPLTPTQMLVLFRRWSVPPDIVR